MIDRCLHSDSLRKQMLKCNICGEWQHAPPTAVVSQQRNNVHDVQSYELQLDSTACKLAALAATGTDSSIHRVSAEMSGLVATHQICLPASLLPSQLPLAM